MQKQAAVQAPTGAGFTAVGCAVMAQHCGSMGGESREQGTDSAPLTETLGKTHF